VASTASGSGGGCFIETAGVQAYWSVQAMVIFGLFFLLVSTLFFFSRRIAGKHLRGRMRALCLSLLFAASMVVMAATQGLAQVQVQCPGDLNGDAIPDEFLSDGKTLNLAYDPDVICMHLAAGDGFINMTDGKLQYMFGFNDVTGIAEADVIVSSMLAATFPAPDIVLPQGKKFYLTLTNVGMMIRPDLFDPHTVHYHGFPNASPIFDGVPDNSISINMGASLTYFYNLVEPGTYMYHCHVEATEHMQMGMLGQLYVTPIQDGTEYPDPDGSGRVYTKFAYNDGDGSTGYDVTYPIQIASFDPFFHDASLTVQPLPFALMNDLYPMLNGRGYPDTINPLPLTNTAADDGYGVINRQSQKMSALIEATQGQKILLRVSSLSTTSFHTLTVLGIPMTVVGQGARILRGPGGKNLFYQTTSVDLGGGEARDVILDTLDVAPGTYFMYSTNLDHLNNNAEDFGGMMTEIRISAAP
jgi:FtsP/CotA-like multicopper oxidase with cupredoxin domain